MKRYKMKIEYDGTNYSGWQVQARGFSVQGIIEDAMNDFFNKKVKIHGSGRTDKGVHAIGQVAHFDIDTTIKEYNMIKALNLKLPADIKIQNIEQVSSNFHAQFDVKSKVYEYKFYISKFERPLLEKDHAQVIPPIDMDLFEEKAKMLVGTHDFAAFCKVGSTANSTIRTINKIEIEQVNSIVRVIIEGDGFLYNMIRIIIGTLVFLAKGKIPKDSIEKMLIEKERILGGKTYAAKGLCLKEVKY